MRTAPAVLALLLLALTSLADPLDEKEKADGFMPLFNGKDLSGWMTYESQPENWTVEDGLLVCNGKGGGWLGTDREYANFAVRLEYRLKPAGNSGVYIRSPEQGHISQVGMEIQILDDNHPKYATLNYYQYTGSIYGVVPPSRRLTKAAGEWNALDIRADGRRLVVQVNGKKVVDADLDRCLQDEEVAKEHPGLARTTGRIGLQSHSERVEFRNIRIKELK
jgi:hypothetical protein